MNEDIQVKELKNKLRYGDMKKICEAAGVSRPTLRRFFYEPKKVHYLTKKLILEKINEVLQ
jgi:AraC-like DNA-binding protein